MTYATRDARHAVLLCSASLLTLLAFPHQAAAQTARAAVPASATAAAPADKPDTDEIVVTGSLISRQDYKANSPISTLGSDTIAAAGQPSLDRAIGQLPQFAGAQGASEVGDAQGTLGFAGGQAYGDLRGIGPNRSLVLLDGRRLMPSSPDGSIDLNTIPTALIENVEVITGGASATYGSDAVAGVVNFKLRHNFSGLELNYQRGGTFKGDGATNRASAIFGGSFGEDRGNFLFAAEYSDRAAVKGEDRAFFRNIRQLARPPEGVIGANNYGGGNPTIAAINTVLAKYSGTTPLAGTGNFTGSLGLNTDGTLFTTGAAPNCVQNFRGLGTTKGINISPVCTVVQVALGQYFDVQVPLKKYNVFTRASYELSEAVTAYGQFNFSDSTARDTTGPGSSKPSVPLLIPQNNPFVTGNADLQTILNSITPKPTGNIVLTKLLTAFGNRVETYKYQVWQALGGIRGTLPGTALTYDIYASYGRSQFTNTLAGDVSRQAVNSILNGTANYTGTAGNCVGYAWNPLGNNPLSAGCLEYAGRTDTTTNTLTQKVIQGTVQGPLFHLPAGDVKFAVGADHRDSSFNYLPDTILRTNDSLPYGLITAASGRQRVSEVFGELYIPLLTDSPIGKELSVDLGYRYSKYDTFKGQSTYKADVSWQPFEAVRLRGGYSRAIRAPSLGDLYGPLVTQQLPIGSPAGAGDPCDVRSIYRTGTTATQVAALCQAQGVPAALLSSFTYGSTSVQGQSGSNRLLSPEKADTYSIGAVFTPHAGGILNNINFSIDYYNIRIKGAIGTLSIGSILPRCFNSDGVSNTGYSANNSFCQRITRDTATGIIANASQGLFNFATYKLSGIDFQADWRFGLDNLGMSAGAGSLQLNSVVTYLRSYQVSGLLGSPTLDYAGSIGFGDVGGNISHPKWKANSGLTYRVGGFDGTVRWRYIGAMKHVDLVANPAATTAGVPAYSYFDVDLGYKFNETLSFSAGINNLTDKGPPFVNNAQLTTDAATYDVIGRSFHVAAKVKF